jgi:hypothetical protein
MGFFRDFILGQPLEKKEDKDSEACEAKKPEPKWATGKNYHSDDFIKLIGIDDTVNKRMFTKGEFAQYREQLTEKIKEVAARKGKDQTFSREEAAAIARELSSKSDNASRLLAKAINNALN